MSSRPRRILIVRPDRVGDVIISSSCLPAIRERVGARGEVLLDGGIRRGSDIIKALCLGADGVFIGRPYVYGLAAGGAEGVKDVIGLLRADLLRTLVLMGCSDVAELNRSWLV